MILATCLTIVAALLAAQGGEEIRLSGDCATPLTVSKVYTAPVVIDARGAKLHGLTITGTNVTWRGGTMVSRDGAVTGPNGYALRIYKARGVRVEGATFGLSRKAIVVDLSSDITVTGGLFDGVGEDGIIASATSGLTITGNVFRGTLGKPTECAVNGGIIYGLSSRDCLAMGGVWKDGFHNDAIQLRNDDRDVLIAGNAVTGETQGIAQMDATTDLPLQRVRIMHNQVAVTYGHAITLGGCLDCAIIDNDVKRGPGSTTKTIIRFQAGTLACGNRVQDVQNGTGPCPPGTY